MTKNELGFDIGFTKTKLKKVKDIVIPEAHLKKNECEYTGINTLFGGGLFPGFTFTVSASRGCGKTSFLMSSLESFKKVNPNLKIAFLSNEETDIQIAIKCRWLKVEEVDVAYMNKLEDILSVIVEYDIVIVDSFQGIKSETKMNEKSLISFMVGAAKRHGTSLGVITHLTKDGKEKGDSAIAHAVDACYHMRNAVDQYFELGKKVCVYCDKNRYGKLVYIFTALSDEGVELFLAEDYFENFEESVLKD